MSMTGGVPTTPAEASGPGQPNHAGPVDTVGPPRLVAVEVDRLSLVVRPKVLVSLAGPLLVVVGLAAAALVDAAGARLLALAVAAVGVAIALAAAVRVDTGAHALRVRRLVVFRRRFSIDAITKVELRRVPPRWVPRFLTRWHIGPYWGQMLRLQVHTADRRALRMTTVWWDQHAWRALARYLGSLPHVEVDPTTKRRLVRYAQLVIDESAGIP